MRIAVLGHNDWWNWQLDGYAKRNAQLVLALARRGEVQRIAVVGSPRPAGRGSQPVLPPGRLFVPVGEKIVAIPHSYPLPVPSRWRLGRAVNDALTMGRVSDSLRSALPGTGPLVMWVADPRMVVVGQRLPHDLLVFDAIDDWRFHAWAGRGAVVDGYRRAAEADVVFAVNEELLVRLAPRHASLVVPNAVDVRPWRDAAPDPSLASFRRPRVGYAGSLQARVDSRLLGELATLMPEAAFIIAGRAMSDFWRHPLGLPANVRLIGKVPHAAMPAVLAAMDACIVPHVVDDFTESMDPLKLYEYLAAGKPVVSTVASPNPRLVPHVCVAKGAAAMADALREEMDGDSRAKAEARRGAVAGDTWDARAATVIETFQRLL